jgi:flagellar protein FliO/FliZ
MRGFISFTASLLPSVMAHAQTTSTRFADPVNATATSSPAVSVAQSLFAMLVVLAVLFAAAWLVKRFKLTGQGGSGQLHVVQGISLGAKERAVLIHVQGRRLLLGVAAGQVTLLAELHGDAPSDASPTEQPAEKSAKPHADMFKDILKRSLGLKERP